MTQTHNIPQLSSPTHEKPPGFPQRRTSTHPGTAHARFTPQYPATRIDVLEMRRSGRERSRSTQVAGRGSWQARKRAQVERLVADAADSDDPLAVLVGSADL